MAKRAGEGLLSGKRCACGCGEETLLVSKSCSRRGRVKGEPNRFVMGHAVRLTRRSPEQDKARRRKFADAEVEMRKRRRREDPEYAETLREWARQHAADRRARLRAQFVESVNRLVVLERDDGTCGICGGDVDPAQFDIDHIVPVSQGGEHSYANVQAAHPFCNRSKHNEVHHGDK